MIRMKHPRHGFHHAYNLLEEEAMRKAGWVEDVAEPAREVEPEADEPEVTPDRAAMLADAEARGIKVDRRWSTARLAEELAKAS
jgi:hypothetical protein